MAEILQERKPSYALVRRIVRSLPAGPLMLAHRSNKVYSEDFDLVHGREVLKQTPFGRSITHNSTSRGCAAMVL